MTMTILTAALCVILPADSRSQPATTQAATTGPADVLATLGRGFVPVVEKLPTGEIDWTRGELVAVGIGKAQGTGPQAAAMARRAARVVALRNAALLSAGIRAGPGAELKNFRGGVLRVESAVRGFEELSSQFDRATGTATVKLRGDLFGLGGLVGLGGLELKGPARAARRLVMQRGPRLDLIVIDARGTEFAPCLWPRLALADGGVLFGATDVARDALPARPTVLYAAAERGPTPLEPGVVRTGPDTRMLVLRGSGILHKTTGTLVLPAEEYLKLAFHARAYELMKAGRLVIVVDAPGREPPPR